MQDYFEMIMLDLCLPSLSLNSKHQEYWRYEPVQFIYSECCKSDDHNIVVNAAELLLKKIAESKTGNSKTAMIYTLMNFIVECLSTGKNPRSGKSVD